MLKLAVKEIRGMVRGFFMNWGPKELTIPSKFCMGRGNSRAELK